MFYSWMNQYVISCKELEYNDTFIYHANRWISPRYTTTLHLLIIVKKTFTLTSRHINIQNVQCIQNYVCLYVCMYTVRCIRCTQQMAVFVVNFSKLTKNQLFYFFKHTILNTPSISSIIILYLSILSLYFLFF